LLWHQWFTSDLSFLSRRQCPAVEPCLFRKAPKYFCNRGCNPIAETVAASKGARVAFRNVSDFTEILFDGNGRRKYLSTEEWRRFIGAADRAEARTRAFCRTLAFTGCRISEALSLTPASLDPVTGCVVLRTLKRRKRVFRAVPVPAALLAELIALAAGRGVDERLWEWCRQTGWRRVKSVMARARIKGLQASPKGLRHGFGIAAAEANIPPGLTQRWMGHARLETTALYQHAVGREERAFAKRLWS
jgi:integrase/recombinase XerD